MSLACCSVFVQKILTSSKKARDICHFKLDGMIFKACSKVAVGRFLPNGIGNEWWIP